MGNERATPNSAGHAMEPIFGVAAPPDLSGRFNVARCKDGPLEAVGVASSWSGKNDRLLPSVVLLAPFEVVELFAVVVGGARRRYVFEQDEARGMAAAYDSVLRSPGAASVIKLQAFLPAPQSRESVGTIFDVERNGQQ